MCWSIESDSTVFNEFYLQKMDGKYWRVSGAG